MKILFKTATVAFTALLMALALASCSDNKEEDEQWIWDYIPIGMNVTVSDASGNDLLHPSQDNGVTDKIHMTYNGEEYTLRIFPEEKAASRYFMATWYGCSLSQDTESDRFFLHIGDWDAFEPEAEVKLHIAGKEYSLSFTNKVISKDKTGMRTFKRSFYLDNILAEESEAPTGHYSIIIR